MTSCIPAGVDIDHKFATLRDLVDFGVALADYYLARITEWDSADVSGVVPILELTGYDDNAPNDLCRCAVTFRAALGRISDLAENQENWVEPPSGALVEAVTAAFLDPLRTFRQYFWHELEWRFEVDVEEHAEFVLENDTYLAPLYAVASKDIVQTTLIINFLQQLREASAKFPSNSPPQEEAEHLTIVAS